jgi:hypothetical protein
MYTESDTNAHQYANRDCNNHPSSNSDTYCNANTNTQCYAYSYFYAYSQAHAHSQAKRNPQNTANSTTAPVAFIDGEETHC